MDINDDATGGWPHQLHVREASRMISGHVVARSDFEAKTRPAHPVGLASHGVDDWPYATVALDGNVALQGGGFSILYLDEGRRNGSYAIPYEAIVPQKREYSNLLVPVCCSAGHIAMTPIRFRPHQIAAVEIGHRQGIETLTIPDTEPTLEIHAMRVVATFRRCQRAAPHVGCRRLSPQIRRSSSVEFLQVTLFGARLRMPGHPLVVRLARDCKFPAKLPHREMTAPRGMALVLPHAVLADSKGAGSGRRLPRPVCQGSTDDPMTETPTHERLAVCSWSLQAANPRELAEKLQATGISRVQLALDPLREEPAVWGETKAVLQQAGITIVSGMFGCVGEDYSTLDTIRVTGGIAPDETWEQNQENTRATVDIAKTLGLKLVTFHAGFVPHDPADPAFAKMVDRLKAVAGMFAAADMTVGLETGQETAEGLATLLEALRQPNVAVNFDPANMLLYGKGDPIQAVRVLARWIRQVHAKDANASPTPGTWGEEVAVGSGQVDWPVFFSTLAEVGFTGDIVIEREAGTQRVADIRTAREVVLKSIF